MGFGTSSERRSSALMRALIALLFFALACAPRALAQDASEEEDVAAATPSEEPGVEEARDRFRRGVALARAGDCSGAIVELEASYQLWPRANTLFNLGQCEERLHRYDLAIGRYEEYLRVAPADADDRITVEETLASLRQLLGTIRITTNTEAEVWLGDRVVGVAPGDVLVPGGRHAIELRAEGMIPERRQVDVTPRATVELEIELRPAEQIVQQTIETTVEQHVTVERPPLHVAVFGTGVGLTVAAAIVGIAAGANALALHDEQAARDPRLPRDEGPSQGSALIADIMFGAAGALAIATVVVAFLTDWEGGPPSDEAPAPTAWIAPGLGGVAVGGTF